MCRENTEDSDGNRGWQGNAGKQSNAQQPGSESVPALMAIRGPGEGRGHGAQTVHIVRVRKGPQRNSSGEPISGNKPGGTVFET